MIVDAVASPEKFIPLERLPNSFPIDESTSVRKIVPGDSDTLSEIIDRNHDVKRYITWAALVNGPEDVVPALQSRSSESMVGRYTIVRGNVVGYFGINPVEEDDEYELGYFLDKTARGQGLVRKTVATILNFAKDELSVQSMYLSIAPENTASIAVAEHFGFHPTEVTVWVPELQIQEQRFRLEMSNEAN